MGGGPRKEPGIIVQVQRSVRKGLSLHMRQGFDNEKYIELQAANIRKRIAQFGGKLYLEFGGKLFDDYHASRVLPGFEPDSKFLLGAAFKPVSSELKRQLNLGYGLEVTGVSNGKMADAGIRKGFIILKANNVQMKSVEDLEKVLKAATQSPDQVLFITGMFPSGKRASYAVDLTQE